MKVINLRQTEQDLIAKAIVRNRAAQQQLYNKFAPKMLGVCRQYTKDVPQAEDLMITAFMKVFTNLEKFEHNGSFEGWIRRIMVNECISWLRVQKKTNYLEDEFFVESTENPIETIFEVNDIQHLIDQLPDGYKMVFNLYAIEGFKHQEIAKMLNISEGTSKSQLSHARSFLQKQINKRNFSDNGTN